MNNLLLSIFLFIVTLNCIDAKDKYTLTNGIVYSSKNGSIISNPANLTLEAGDTIEGLIGLPQDGQSVNGDASYSGNFGTVGIGAMFYSLNSSNYIIGALGVDAGFVKMGLSGKFDTASMNSSGDLGLRFGPKGNGLAGSIVVRDFIGGFNNFEFGLAGAWDSIILEADITYASGLNFTSSLISLTFNADKFCLLIAYSIPLNSTASFSTDNLKLGASFEVTNKLDLIALYHGEFADITLGLRFKL